MPIEFTVSLVGLIGGLLGSVVSAIASIITAYIQKGQSVSFNKTSIVWFIGISAVTGIVFGVLVALVWPRQSAVSIGTVSALYDGAVLAYDFEDDNEIEAWTSNTTLLDKGDVAFSGSSSLRDTLVLTSTQQVYFKFDLSYGFTGNIIIGRVYWPDSPLANIDWSEACVIIPPEPWSCEPVPLQRGQWNTFVINLTKIGDPPLSTRRINNLIIQGGVSGTVNNRTSSIPIYVDTIEIR
ncbi:hypothetical protein [Candidatus Chloroploca sp. Khr17]|uniref:hypothetical protein n=1 Tax=Candidatus Chloroploca sp. Khr17 TaxID=2496869 RepID=UPI00101D340C|nr:hypothetical protein [Candidatus Chloroploca sp. Khr17]